MHVLIMSDPLEVLAREALAHGHPAYVCRVDSAGKNRPQPRKKRMTEAINSLHVAVQAGIYK